MTTSSLYHNQGIKSFNHVATEYRGGTNYTRIERKEHSCTACGSREVNIQHARDRQVRGQNVGSSRLVLEVAVHRIHCPKCKSLSCENLDFLPHPKSRITRSLARAILELRREMSLSAIAKYCGLDWDTVKNLEKDWLTRKYRRIRMSDVRIIGINEIHVGHEWVDGKRLQKYMTVVRDMQSWAVLFTGDGKGSKALTPLYS